MQIDILYMKIHSLGLSPYFLGRCADLPQPNRRRNAVEIAMVVCSRNVLTIPLDYPWNIHIASPVPKPRVLFFFVWKDFK